MLGDRAALELGYVDLGAARLDGLSDGLGSTRFPRWEAGPVSALVENHGWTLAAAWHGSAFWRTRVSARIGVYRWSTEVIRHDRFGELRNSDEGVGGMLGLGFDFALGPRLALGADWSRYSAEFDGGEESFDVDSLTATLLVRF